MELVSGIYKTMVEIVSRISFVNFILEEFQQSSSLDL